MKSRSAKAALRCADRSTAQASPRKPRPCAGVFLGSPITPTQRKPRLRAGAAAARGFRPPRGSASCSNTRARYIHVPLGRNPLAAASFAPWRSSLRRDTSSGMPEPISTKPRTFSWRKTRWCGDRAQAGHGWPALACWSHGWRNQAMCTIPALPRLPPKATNPGALRPHCRGSPRRRKLQCFETAPPRLPPKPVDSGAFRLDVFRLPPIERRAKTNGARGAPFAFQPCRAVAQSASKMPAAPMPVPMHMVTMPYFCWRRRRPWTRVAVRIAPVAPSGWPSAIAPPSGLT